MCIANIKQLQDAKTQWAFEQKKQLTDTPVESDLIGPTTYLRQKPFCPGGGDDYITTVGTVQEKVTCTLAAEGHTL